MSIYFRIADGIPDLPKAEDKMRFQMISLDFKHFLDFFPSLLLAGVSLHTC